MALGTFVAGRYSATWDADRGGAGAAVNFGISEDGWEVQWQYGMEPISPTDAYGQMYIDGIYQGIVGCWTQSTQIEWTTAIVGAVTPWNTWSATSGTLSPGVIGRLASDVAGTIVLTATASTPAATSPASLTATYCIISEDVLRVLYSSRLRKLPGRWRVLPYLDTTIKFLTTT